MGAEDGPSEAEEEEKEAKRQRSASTTPRSTPGTLPHEYDMVMGIAPVEPQGSERFEEGNDQTFRMLKRRLHTTENNQRYTVIQSQKPLGLGNSMGDMAARRYKSA